MPEISLNIIQFIEHPDLLNDRTLSFAQKVCLKAIYGLPLEPEELELYQHATGRQSYEAIELREATILAGRRGGKTTKIAARIVIYEAVRDHGIPRGESARAMLVAPTLQQARIAFRAIRREILNSNVLATMVVRSSKDELELKNGITIACHACALDHVRGYTVVAVVCDEIAFWSDDETSANPAEEVICALLPGMATVRNAKLVKISTPYRKEGLLWREFQQRSELPFPVFQLSSEELNPTISSSILEMARGRSEEKFQREFMAEFVDTITGWIGAEILDACVLRGHQQMPPVKDALYAAAIDPATRGDDFALAIVHRQSDGLIVVDRVAKWTGTKSAPLVSRVVLGEIKKILELFGINTVLGDQYCFDLLQQEFLELGIYYESRPFGVQTRAEIFSTLKHVILQRRIQLVDDPDLLRQLRHLHEERNARGNMDVRPTGGVNDDLAVVVALATTEIANQPSRPSPFLFGNSTGLAGVRVERDARGREFNILPSMVPATCPNQVQCANLLRCLELKSCQGFENNELT